MDDYKKEYLKTCDTINEMIQTKWPGVGANGCSPLHWAEANAPELYKQEEKLDGRINVLWQNALDFDTFKKTVTDWGRTVLKIYKEYSEATAEKAELAATSSGSL